MDEVFSLTSMLPVDHEVSFHGWLIPKPWGGSGKPFEEGRGFRLEPFRTGHWLLVETWTFHTLEEKVVCGSC